MYRKKNIRIDSGLTNTVSTDNFGTKFLKIFIHDFLYGDYSTYELFSLQ